MTDRHTVQTCRWAEPTLFRDDPEWTEAEEYPWSCHVEGDPEIVPDTARCATCGLWVPRGERGAAMRRCPDFALE